ncbi:hypothetical protein CALCODRAFT_502021 [Calocera cornea HHB12733]|uniref:Uncharacterized protein n=1 Tax=Calocera cornea HHB12733 TaxID=1353952 RepID=A0A165DF58_9BASI|nr:hypothetical protein CALCODRAFT_502021 [Calocera cornea HHB12733]
MASLMQTNDDSERMTFEAAFNFLLCAETSNPGLSAACTRIRAIKQAHEARQESLPWGPRFTTNTLKRLVAQLTGKEDPRYSVSVWLVREYMEQVWDKEVVKSGWLQLMADRGLEALFMGAHSPDDLSEVEEVIARLGYPADTAKAVHESGILLNLEKLYGGRLVVVVAGKLRKDLIRLLRRWYGNDEYNGLDEQTRAAMLLPIPIETEFDDLEGELEPSLRDAMLTMLPDSSEDQDDAESTLSVQSVPAALQTARTIDPASMKQERLAFTERWLQHGPALRRQASLSDLRTTTWR